MSKLCRFVLSVIAVLIGVGLPDVAAAAATPAAWLAFYSTPGDYIGGGINQLFQQSVAGETFDATGTAAGITVNMYGGQDSFTLRFQPVQGAALKVGDYANAEQAYFQSPGHPGMDISGDSRGCGRVTGEFAVEDIAFDNNGGVTRLAIAFDQHCEADTSALVGEIRYNEPPSGPLTIQAATLLFRAHYVGVANPSVPLWVTNPAGSPAPVGAVTVSGTGASDVAITANTCPALHGAGATCVVTATVTPRRSVAN